MTDIAAWLEHLGLTKYTPIFSENELELADLSELSDDDLKEIGLPLGPRRRILKAIRARDVGDRVPRESTGDDAADAHTHVEAERRQLTVMFCDLVGSTALSQKLDPEDYREIIGSFQKTVSEAVRRFDGYVAKYLGDGVLAYFGYPQAHEDDAELAVRGALASVSAVGRLKGTPDDWLEVRVGIATGLVVAGDIVDEDVSEIATISGATPNLAARLQAAAEPGCVVIDETTHDLIGQLLKSTALEKQILKGISEPVAAWRVANVLNDLLGRRCSCSGFLSHLHSLVVTMSLKPSLRNYRQFVP